MATQTEYTECRDLIESALKTQSSSECAKICRAALSEILNSIYHEAGKNIPSKASLLELLHSEVVSERIPDKDLIAMLDYVRILGMNAEHGQHIKKTEAALALSNISHLYEELIKQEHACCRAPNITEAATRKLYIDAYLEEAGWHVLEEENVVLPEKACIEIEVDGMPNREGVGFCDYVLFGRDSKPLAIVEAKKTTVDISQGRHQVDLYGECMEKRYGYKPILYYSNGYETKLIDGIYPDRPVSAFHSISDLERMLQRRERKSISDFSIDDRITNRPYQKIAVTKICEHLNENHRRGLLVMATGTGKTRVAISLVDVLSRNKWIKNVLFLADRITLVSQAKRNFAKLLPNMSICELSGTDKIDYDARLMFSTYQTMINYIDAEEKSFSSGRFDLIIIDEAHRSIFKKYSSIFKYFDSFLIGLTATPKDEVDSNTYKIFGCESGIPNFDYSLQEAINDHYLVGYKAILRTPQRLIEGVPYDELSDEDKKRVEESYDDEEPPEIIPGNEIFKYIYNKDTCRKVLEDLMSEGIKTNGGEKIGKTIIFAYNHSHAQMIVDCFHELYPRYGANYCQLVDYHVNYSKDLVEKFEETEDFRIAVSVDMLDTGVDVPQVLNLVFFKPVKSKIKFVQMIGRGTRLCPNVFGPNKDKDHFLIFDYCGNFEYFSIHPDGKSTEQGLSLSQRIFEKKLDILYELQRLEYQEDDYCKVYYEETKSWLVGKVKDIKSNSSRLQVREQMKYVDCYCDFNNWRSFSPVSVKEIKYHLVGLIDSGLEGNELALAFDSRVFDVELDVLINKSILGSKKSVNKIQSAAQYLLKERATIPQVIEKKEVLQQVVSEQFWGSPTVHKLESIREELRELMKFLEGSRRTQANIDIDDHIEDSDFTVEGTDFDIRTYRERVIDYLKKHSNLPVIKKIENLEPITNEDLDELHRILCVELGTEEVYQKEINIPNFAVFIRSLIGLSQEAVNEKFGEYLNGTKFNSSQQEYIMDIINYVRENGDITREDLVEKEQFHARGGLLDIFGPAYTTVVEIVDLLHSSIVAAA